MFELLVTGGIPGTMLFTRGLATFDRWLPGLHGYSQRRGST